MPLWLHSHSHTHTHTQKGKKKHNWRQVNPFEKKNKIDLSERNVLLNVSHRRRLENKLHGSEREREFHLVACEWLDVGINWEARAVERKFLVKSNK